MVSRHHCLSHEKFIGPIVVIETEATYMYTERNFGGGTVDETTFWVLYGHSDQDELFVAKVANRVSRHSEPLQWLHVHNKATHMIRN